MLGGICIVLAVVVAVLVIERRRPNPDVAALLTVIDRVLVTVGELCDKVQAPQLAALRGQQDEVDPRANPVAVDSFDDDDYWESREALAERMSAVERDGDG